MREELKIRCHRCNHCNRPNHRQHLPTHLPTTIVYFGFDEIATVVNEKSFCSAPKNALRKLKPSLSGPLFFRGAN